VGGTHTCCTQPWLITMQFLHFWTIKESPQRPYNHVGWWYAQGCGTMV
jgi:hypothetical protein